MTASLVFLGDSVESAFVVDGSAAFSSVSTENKLAAECVLTVSD